MTDSGGNGIRSRVRFGVRGNEGVGSRTCLRGASEIGVTLVNASAAPVRETKHDLTAAVVASSSWFFSSNGVKNSTRIRQEIF